MIQSLTAALTSPSTSFFFLLTSAFQTSTLLPVLPNHWLILTLWVGAFILALLSPCKTLPLSSHIPLPLTLLLVLLTWGSCSPQKTSDSCLETYLIVTAEEGASPSNGQKPGVLLSFQHTQDSPNVGSYLAPDVRNAAKGENPCPLQLFAPLFSPRGEKKKPLMLTL